MRTGILFMAGGNIDAWEVVRVLDGKLAFPLGAKPDKDVHYVYGIALSVARIGEPVTVDIGDAIPRADLCRSLDGAEAELRDILKKVQDGDK